jgi:hypothetical protein
MAGRERCAAFYAESEESGRAATNIDHGFERPFDQ